MSQANTKIKTGEKLPPIPEDVRKEFRKLVSVQTKTSNEHEMHYYLTRWLDKRKLSWKYDVVGNILVTKGEAEYFPCIVSHMDTVHDIVPNFKIMTVKHKDGHDIWYAKDGNTKTGIGGDDKCGVFSCLYALEKLDNVKVIFFTQEEGGCKGSRDIDLSLLEDAGYIIQLDRWGRKDFICKDSTTPFVSEEFNDLLLETKIKFGYSDASGLVTDSVKLFRRGIGVSCINVSCGYYQHHTNSEKIDLNQYWNSLRFLIETVEVLGENAYHHEEVKSKTVVTGYRHWPSSYEYDAYDERDHIPDWAKSEYKHDENGIIVKKGSYFDKEAKKQAGTDSQLSIVHKKVKEENDLSIGGIIKDGNVSDATADSLIDTLDNKQYTENQYWEDTAANFFIHCEPQEAGEDLIFGSVETIILDEIFEDLGVGAFNNHKYEFLSFNKKAAIKHQYYTKTDGCTLLDIKEVGF